MKPEDIEFQLSQLLDGQLNAQEAQALRQKMARDPVLAEQYRQIERLEASLGNVPAAELNVDWDLQRESIHAKLERQTLLAPARNPVLVRLLRWSAATGAAAALIAGIFLTVQVVNSGRRTSRIEVVWSQSEAPAPAHRPQIQAVMLPEPSGRPQVRYSEAGKAPEIKSARAARGMVLIAGPSDDSPADTLDLAGL